MSWHIIRCPRCNNPRIVRDWQKTFSCPTCLYVGSLRRVDILLSFYRHKDALYALKKLKMGR